MQSRIFIEIWLNRENLLPTGGRSSSQGRRPKAGAEDADARLKVREVPGGQAAGVCHRGRLAFQHILAAPLTLSNQSIRVIL